MGFLRKQADYQTVKNVVLLHGASDPIPDAPIIAEPEAKEFVAHYDSLGYQIAKRVFDIVFSGIALLLLFPLFFVVACVIVAEDGMPVIYKQQRVGRGGRAFWMLKFRSMRRDAEQILHSNPELLAEYRKNFKLKNDPRVLKCGQFMRKSTIDELPQLINVFRGEMSIVGPRPLLERESDRYGIACEIYECMKPGCAGLWQAGGRSDLSFDERIMLDVRYYVTASFWNDLLVIGRTAVAVLQRKGAV
jgi:lipopolysaccharide/colanic/teichoic acid biosynthesis glycosyltransferase